MSDWVHVVLLCVLFVAMGVLATPAGGRRWHLIADFLGAIGLGVLLTTAGLLVVVVVLAGYVLGLASLSLPPDPFLGVISVALAAGILLFLALLSPLRRGRISVRTLTITEYYIQWFLIYVTVYQVVFDRLHGLEGLLGEGDVGRELDAYLASFLDPSAIVTVLLPVLLAVWIALVMARIRFEPAAPITSSPAGSPGPASPA